MLGERVRGWTFSLCAIHCEMWYTFRTVGKDSGGIEVSGKCSMNGAIFELARDSINSIRTATYISGPRLQLRWEK